MDFKALESAIIERLKAKLQEESSLTASVRSMPNNPEKEAMLSQAELWVAYSGSAFTTPKPNDQGVIVQERRAQITIYSRCKNFSPRNGQDSIYQYLQFLDANLPGWTPTGIADAAPFVFGPSKYVSQSEGVWLYESVYEMGMTEARAIEAPPEEEP